MLQAARCRLNSVWRLLGLPGGYSWAFRGSGEGGDLKGLGPRSFSVRMWIQKPAMPLKKPGDRETAALTRSHNCIQPLRQHDLAPNLKPRTLQPKQ